MTSSGGTIEEKSSWSTDQDPANRILNLDEISKHVDDIIKSSEEFRLRIYKYTLLPDSSYMELPEWVGKT